MPDPARAERECRALSRYLLGAEPTPYVVSCFARARHTEPAARIDRILVRSALAGPWPARMADAYARLARPTGTLRRRLTLLVAILESAPGSHRTIAVERDRSTGSTIVRLALALAGSAAAMLAGLVVFGPVHLVTGLADRGPAKVPSP